MKPDDNSADWIKLVEPDVDGGRIACLSLRGAFETAFGAEVGTGDHPDPIRLRRGDSHVTITGFL